MKKKLLICGSRGIKEYKTVLKALKYFNIDPKNIEEIVSGKARGVDTLGEEWAKNNGISIKEYSANWKKEGRSAGFKRNEKMVKYILKHNGIVIAIYDGNSPGTADTISRCYRYSVPIMIYTINNDKEMEELC